MLESDVVEHCGLGDNRHRKTWICHQSSQSPGSQISRWQHQCQVSSSSRRPRRSFQIADGENEALDVARWQKGDSLTWANWQIFREWSPQVESDVSSSVESRNEVFKWLVDYAPVVQMAGDAIFRISTVQIRILAGAFQNLLVYFNGENRFPIRSRRWFDSINQHPLNFHPEARTERKDDGQRYFSGILSCCDHAKNGRRCSFPSNFFFYSKGMGKSQHKSLSPKPKG